MQADPARIACAPEEDEGPQMRKLVMLFSAAAVAVSVTDRDADWAG